VVVRRVRELGVLLVTLTVTAPQPHPSGRAYFGAWVTVEHEDGREMTYRLVGPDETDSASGSISVEAPLGRALLGKKKGDVVPVTRPAGLTELIVVAVRWTRPRE
jgi:transcription elongation factor GreB